METEKRIDLNWWQVIKALRQLILLLYYDRLRWKYSHIMQHQFMNGYSNSPEYYKWKRYKAKADYYEYKLLKQYHGKHNP